MNSTALSLKEKLEENDRRLDKLFHIHEYINQQHSEINKIPDAIKILLINVKSF